MKKIFPVALKIFVIFLATSYGIVADIMRKVSSLTFTIMPEFLITRIMIIAIAALLALSIIKFKFENKVQKIILAVAILADFIVVIALWPYYSLNSFRIVLFVCVVYIMDLILNKCPRKLQ